MKIGGPELDAIVREAKEWYVNTRQELIKALEEPRPYNSKELTPIEQLIRFDEMQSDPQLWSQFILSLYDRYRGLPDVERRVNADLTRYISSMFRLRQQIYPQGELRGEQSILFKDRPI